MEGTWSADINKNSTAKQRSSTNFIGYVISDNTWSLVIAAT